MKRILWFSLTLLVSTDHAAALDPNTSDPAVILRASFEAQAGPSTLSRMRMSIKDGSGQRQRVLTIRSKRYSDADKTLVLIEQPADVRNTGFLSVDYHDPGHADEQWLYLPNLYRVTRIPNSGKADAFVGSDFSISDLSPQAPESYTLKLIAGAVKVGTEPCWQIEATPRTASVKAQTGYERTQVWVSQTTLLPVQTKAWSQDGKHVKYFKASDVRKVAGSWTAFRMQMRTMLGDAVTSETLVELLEIEKDTGQILDSDFSQQRLEQGA